MAEIRLIVCFSAREGKAEELKSLFAKLVQSTRTEAGCKMYELSQSTKTGAFYLNEHWESKAHLDAHMATAHFKESSGQTHALMTGEPTFDFLKIVAS